MHTKRAHDTNHICMHLITEIIQEYFVKWDKK